MSIYHFDLAAGTLLYAPRRGRHFDLNLSWIDWTIVAVAVVGVRMVSWASRSLMRGVADFLSANRLAGRYLLTIAGGMGNTGVISMVGAWQVWAAGGILAWVLGICVGAYRHRLRAHRMGVLQAAGNPGSDCWPSFLRCAIAGVFIFAGPRSAGSRESSTSASFPQSPRASLIYFCGPPDDFASRLGFSYRHLPGPDGRWTLVWRFFFVNIQAARCW